LFWCSVLSAWLSLSTSLAGSKGFYLDVPYVHQVENYCGPAVLSMVFRYWDRPADQYQLSEHWKPFPRRGLSGSQLKESALKHGFKAYSFAGDVDEVSGYLGQGIPVIVAIDSSSVTKSSNHFLLLVGHDISRQEWIVHDPAEGAFSRRSTVDFEKKWANLKNWSLIIFPDGVSQ